MSTKSEKCLLCVLLLLFGGILVFEAFSNAPTSDESTQLIASVAMARTADPAFYRVNPPAHRLISGLAVDLLFKPELRGLYPASEIASGDRHEFPLAQKTLEAYGESYPRLFFVGRLCRVPFLVLAAWVLFQTATTIGGRVAGSITLVLWITSPLILGHGWAIMPDALSACTMTMLIAASLAWLRTRTWFSFVLNGACWGIAIGTKFTFCPLFLFWPIALWIYHVISVQEAISQRFWYCWKIFAGHVGHGFIALVVVIALYAGRDVGVRFGDHGFASEHFSKCVDAEHWLGRYLHELRSPFPKQFLLGIDEQYIDLETGLPTYILGQWYPDGVWWYYLLGLLVKEQVVFLFGLVLLPVGGWFLRARASDSENAHDSDNGRDSINARDSAAAFYFCVFVVIAVLAILSVHSRMALNVRYTFPCLPAIYIAIGLAVSRLWSCCVGSWKVITAVVAVLIVATELFCSFPHYFSYVNPLFGGSYRVPPALHDSNFDGGQDLWRLNAWIRKHPIEPGCRRFTCVHTGLPASIIGFDPFPPPPDILKGVLEYGVANDPQVPYDEIVVMRGLETPAIWTKLVGETSLEQRELLKQLKSIQPYKFITPTIAVFRVARGKEK